MTALRWIVGLALSLGVSLSASLAGAQVLERAGGDVPISIEAENGIEWLRDQKTYLARGNAKVIRGNVTIMAETLAAFYRDKAEGGGTEIFRLEATGSVHIISGSERTRSERADYDLDKSVLVLSGGDLRFESGADVITARDSLEYWERRKIAIARGNALAVRADKRIAAETLTARFDKNRAGEDEITQIDALGGVRIDTDQETATGNEGLYNLVEEVAELRGNVLLSRGQDRLSGERAIVNLRTGVSRMLPKSGSKERVKGLFTPKAGTQ